MRVLGIDPGSRKAGWGLVDVCKKTRKMTHVDNGVIMLDANAPLHERLVVLSKRLHDVVETYRPQVAAVEDVFVNKGARSALVLGQARGAVLATLGLCGLQVESHTNNQVKSRVTGRGRASKEQVNDMVRALLGLAHAPFEDAADALAVALCQGMQQLEPNEVSAALLKTSSTRRGKGRGTKDGFLALAKAQGKF
ncbi:MAG: crossover junction endodeoxyribonuclease RuvC [Deltaproteobacteria bacterium]|nr:crossover junction endodeoxyribonuclease RuvC [Deltaproteobacteria bacterium]